MENSAFSFSDMVIILNRTPEILISWLTNLPPKWQNSNEGGESWSPYDIVGHLIHGEKTDWMARLDIILSDAEHRQFESFDRFAQFEESKGKSMEELLMEFSRLRDSNIQRFKSLDISESDLDRKAIHPELGEVNLRQLLSTWVVHDLGHMGQIARVMAKQWRHEVGPWQDYIPILHR